MTPKEIENPIHSGCHSGNLEAVLKAFLWKNPLWIGELRFKVMGSPIIPSTRDGDDNTERDSRPVSQ